MASSRRLPVSFNTSTYDSAGGKDYSSLSAWESATDINLVSALNGEVLDCFKGVHFDTVDIFGATVNSSYFRVIRPAAGEGHKGIPELDGSVVAFSTSATTFTASESFFQCHDIVAQIIAISPSDRASFLLVGSDAACVGCMCVDSINTGTGIAQGILSFVSTFVVNCLMHNIIGDGITDGVGLMKLYNSTAQGCTLGFKGNATIKNCLGDGNTTDYSGTFTATTCGSSDATSPTVALRNQTYAFKNAAGDDFRLAFGSDGIDDGTDLSADGNYAFDDDIEKHTRIGAWDIGFFEFLTANKGSGFGNGFDFTFR